MEFIKPFLVTKSENSGYFPIKIVYCDSDVSLVINSPDEIESARAFKVIEVSVCQWCGTRPCGCRCVLVSYDPYA